MKRITILLASALMLSMASQAKAQTPVNEYPASDSKIVWVGRAIAQGDQVSGDWTGIYARIKFAGDGLAIKVSDTKKNYYNLWLDKETWNEPGALEAAVVLGFASEVGYDRMLELNQLSVTMDVSATE